MRRRQPVVVLGAGGFVSGPGGIAAWLTRRPLVIHEQNAVAGMTNRILARFASRVLEGFPEQLPRQRSVRSMSAIPCAARSLHCRSPQHRFAGSHRSDASACDWRQPGCAKLNAALPAALALLPKAERPDGAASGRRAHISNRQSRPYRRSTVCRPMCAPSSTTWPSAYAWADLVVCRSGALTVSEIGGGRSRCDLRAVRRRRGRSPDAQCAVPGRRRCSQDPAGA